MGAGDHHNALIPLDQRQRRPCGAKEFEAQAGSPGLVPLEGLPQVGLGSRPKKQTRRHAPRCSISSSASRQGWPGSPSRRYSSLCRRSSAASSGVRGKRRRAPGYPRLLGELDSLFRREVREVEDRRTHVGNVGPTQMFGKRIGVRLTEGWLRPNDLRISGGPLARSFRSSRARSLATLGDDIAVDRLHISAISYCWIIIYGFDIK
jgi:hypothetical protein